MAQKLENLEELDGVLYSNIGVKVEQLIVGYSHEKTGSACGSVSLITIDGFNILVDCGLPSTNFQKYFDSKKIRCVIVTHWHSDHCGRLCEFPGAQKIFPDIESDREEIFPDNINRLELLKLSGHSEVDLAVVIRPTLESDELIVITGDLFENSHDYFSNEPAVKGFDANALIKNRQKIRDLNPSIIVPGHGKAFRLRPTLYLNAEINYGIVTVRHLIMGTFMQDPVWLLIAGEQQILINTSKMGLSKELMKDNKPFTAIVILKPSVRSANSLGLFNANKIYMDGDVLQPPDIYSSLNESEWIIDQVVKVVKNERPMSLQVEIYDPKDGKILKVIK